MLMTRTQPSVTESAEPLVDLDGGLVLSPVPVEDMSTGGDNDVMKSSDDHALKAFSQLLALKLNCEQSMVSLIDRTNQCAFLPLCAPSQ